MPCRYLAKMGPNIGDETMSEAGRTTHVNGADVLTDVLLLNGVDVCFANPGTSEMHFVAALDRKPQLRCILGLHENVVTGAADGYARMTGRPAATLLHTGPGLANGLANMHNARRARTPMIDPDVMKALTAHAARRDLSLSLVAEAGIASFLSPDAAERQEAATTKRLDQLDRRIARMERDLGISVETLAVFIRFWLTSNPPLPEPAQIAARAKAAERYEAFVTALGRRLAQGPKLRQEIAEDIPAHDAE